MNTDKIDNEKFGVSGSIVTEAGEYDDELSICLFSTVNAEAWIEITFSHNDGEMRHWRI